MPSLLPVCLLALLLLLQSDDASRRLGAAATAPRAHGLGQAATLAAEPAVLTAIALAPAHPGDARSSGIAPGSPLFEEFAPRRPTPLAVADAPPPAQADDARLLAAVQDALPRLGGTAEATWVRPTSVGPVLQVRWQPGVALAQADEVRDAVVAAVETVVQAMDRAFPDGFRGDQGTPLAAVQVALPDHDPVLVAVRTYREFAAGETSLAQLPGQWRLLSRAAAAPARPAPPPRLVPEGPTEGAPARWPPQIARWYAEVLYAAQVYQLDPDLLAAIMQQESGGRPDAVGAWAWIPHMGRYERAIGMMQVMPNESERRGVSIDEAWEPQTNILLGARVLRDKLNVIRGDFWTRVQGYYGFGDPLSDYWLDRVYAYWLAFREPPAAR